MEIVTLQKGKELLATLVSYEKARAQQCKYINIVNCTHKNDYNGKYYYFDFIAFFKGKKTRNASLLGVPHTNLDYVRKHG